MFDWFKRAKKQDPLAPWRVAWTEAIDGPGGPDVTALRQQFDAARGGVEDVEVELEMLDAAEALAGLHRVHATTGLPTVDTHHRVIGAEACHFTAPASLPGDQAQASGRLLFTSTRAVFVGGGRSTLTAWHTVHEVLRSDRDVLLVKPDASAAGHYRFNTYTDAVTAAFLARQLRKARTTPRL